MTLQPPAELGRGVVVLPGIEPPRAWSSCPRVVIGDASLTDLGPVVEELHGYWASRRPVVIELGADPAALRAPESSTRPVYEHVPAFEFSRERMQFLVWANNYDARSGEPIWWHGRKAARRYADERVTEGGLAEGGDVLLADGTPLFIDGGPPQPPQLASGVAVVHRWNAEAGRLRPVGHVRSVADLAPDQLAAVGHISGPARVIAPAGSGKTRVLTERLRHLVSGCGVHPGTVTALAYNNKAAGELRLRCSDIEGAQALNIRTLNSLGLWICNEFGRTGRLRVLEEAGSQGSPPDATSRYGAKPTRTRSPRTSRHSPPSGSVSPPPSSLRKPYPTQPELPRGSRRTGPRWPTSARWTSTSRSIGPSKSS